MRRRTTVAAATAATAVTLAGCGGDAGPRADNQAKLPVESAAVAGGTNAECERQLPPPDPDAVPPAGTPFLAQTVWYAREKALGSEVRRAYAPAASPRTAMDELKAQLRRGEIPIEGENAEEGRATVTYSDRGSGVSVIITPFCVGYVELAYHFPTPFTTASP